MKMDVRRFARAKDQKAEILLAMKDALPKIEVARNGLLVATYIRPSVTAGGIELPDSTLMESQYQGKVGLLLKCGPDAFMFPEDHHLREQAGGDAKALKKIRDRYPKVGDWIFYNANDAWQCGFGEGVPCRIIKDEFYRGVTTDPKVIW